jgi:hypothetical protein
MLAEAEAGDLMREPRGAQIQVDAVVLAAGVGRDRKSVEETAETALERG